MLEARLLLDAIKMPYLQAVTENSIYVLLEANSQAPAAVEYGLTNAYGRQAATESTASTGMSSWIHNIKLTGLMPNTVYHYRATQGATTSADYSFRTTVQPGTSFRFAWEADLRTNIAPHNTIAGRIGTFNPDFEIIGGDLCETQTWASWNTQFFVPNEQAVIAQVPFFNAVGNHESWTTLTKAYTQGPTPAGEASGYFSFNYGDLHVLVLNTEVAHGQGSAQWNFAAADLAASTSQWNIVATHKPAYSSYRAPDPDMVAMTSALFEPAGVDMVLCGHDHYYQHNLVNGIHHMVIGSAGAPLVPPSTGPYTVYAESTYNFGIFDVAPDRMTMTTYRMDGSVIETIILTRPGPVAADDSYSLQEDQALTVPAGGVLGNDTGESALSAELVTSPQHGVVALNADGSFTYTPQADFNGTDTFTYRAFDGVLYSDPATVTLDVAPVPDAPRVAPQSLAVRENSPVGTVVGTVAASDVDAGATWAFEIVDGNLGTAFAIDAATGRITVRNTAALDYETTPRFDLLVRVTDNDGLAATATVTVALQDVPEHKPPAGRTARSFARP